MMAEQKTFIQVRMRNRKAAIGQLAFIDNVVINTVSEIPTAKADLATLPTP